MSHQSHRNFNDVVRYNLQAEFGTESRIWRGTSRALYLPRMTSPEVAIALYFFAQPRFKPIGEGENFHSCNKLIYYNDPMIYGVTTISGPDIHHMNRCNIRDLYSSYQVKFYKCSRSKPHTVLISNFISGTCPTY